jgi:hypothetical protein
MLRAATKLTSTVKKSKRAGRDVREAVLNSVFSRLVTRGSRSQVGRELSVSRIDGAHAGGAAGKQDRHEAAGGCAHINGARAAHAGGDAKMRDGGFQLAPAAGELRFHGPVNLRGFASLGTSSSHQ